MALIIRRLQDADVPQVAEVLHTCFAKIERWDEELVRQLIGQPGPPSSTWWLAADGPRVAGCIRVHALARADAYVIRELAVRRREYAILDPPAGRPPSRIWPRRAPRQRRAVAGGRARW